MKDRGSSPTSPSRPALPLLALVLWVSSARAATISFILTPNTAPQGTTLDVTTNYTIPLTGTISFEPAGLTVSNPRHDTKQHLVFTLTIPPNAPTGPYAFVYQPAPAATYVASTFRQQGAFTVTSSPYPVIRAIAPDKIFAGDTDVRATVTGANFLPGATLTVGGGVTARVLFIQN